MIFHRALFINSAVLGALLVGVVNAAPSFSCAGNLNDTEFAICNSEDLSQLDNELAEKFSRVRGLITGPAATELANHQKIWLRSRNACGQQYDCIKQHYLDRTAEIQERVAVQTQPSRTVKLSWNVQADGTLERRLLDGTKKRRLPNGETDIQSPDGSVRRVDKTTNKRRYSNVQRIDLPTGPLEFARWGSSIRQNLLNILRNILTPEEMEAYLQTEEDRDFYDVIDWRIESIEFLTEESS